MTKYKTYADCGGESMDPYQRLANAIVLQAVEDYKAALHWLKRHPTNSGTRWIDNVNMACECEQFFCGQWIEMLTNLDGREIMRQIREDVYGRENVPDWSKELSKAAARARTKKECGIG